MCSQRWTRMALQWVYFALNSSIPHLTSLDSHLMGSHNNCLSLRWDVPLWTYLVGPQSWTHTNIELSISRFGKCGENDPVPCPGHTTDLPLDWQRIIGSNIYKCVDEFWAYHLRAVPYRWGFIKEAFEIRVVLLSTSENPASAMNLPVCLVRWQPSASSCCNGSSMFCTNLRGVPSVPQFTNQENQIQISMAYIRHNIGFKK